MSSLLVATETGLFRDGTRIALEGEAVTSIAPAPEGWLAVTGRAEAHLVSPGGTVAALGAATDEIESIAWVDGRAVAGTAGAHLDALGVDGGRDSSFDDAPERDTWYTPWGGPPAVRSLAQGVDGLRWVNVHVGGVVLGDGREWRSTMDIDMDVHQVIADPLRAGTAWCAAAVGLGWTTDAGANWAWTDEGMRSSYARAVAVDGDAIYLSGSDGPGGRHAALYRSSPDEGLVRIAGPFDANLDTGWVAAANGIVAFLTPDGAVMVSTDGGATWEAAFTVEGPRALLIT